MPGTRSPQPEVDDPLVSAARRRETLLCGLVVAGAAALLLALTSLFREGRLPVAGDLGLYHLPLRHFFSRALHEGWSWLWFPSQFSGHYLHGEGQVGMAHPLQQILYRWLPLQPAFAIEWLRTWVLGLAGTWFLLRRLRLRLDASALGAALVAFAPFVLLQFSHLNCISILAHTPWMLLATEVVLRGKTRRSRGLAGAALAALTASTLLLGHPQFAWLALLATASSPLAFYSRAGSAGAASGAGRGVGSRWIKFSSSAGAESTASDSADSAWPRSRLLTLGSALLLGFVLAAVQLVPHLDALGESFRLAPSGDFTASYAVPPSHLLLLLDPWLFRFTVPSGAAAHETAPWPGVLALPLALWLLSHRRTLGKNWQLARWALLLALVGLVLSLGDAGGLGRLLRFVPVVGLFRAPGRYLFLFHLGTALAAALAFDALAQTSERGRKLPGGLAITENPPGEPTTRHPALSSETLVWLPGLFSLLLALLWLGAAAFGLPLPFVNLISGPLRALAGPLLLLGAAAGVTLASRGRTIGLALLLVLALADVATYGVARVIASPTARPDELARLARPKDTPADGRLAWTTLGATMSGAKLAGGYAALAPERVLGLGEPGVDITTPAFAAAARVAGLSRGGGGEKLPDPLPRVRLVNRVKVSADPAADLASGLIDPATTVLLQPGLIVVPRLDSGSALGEAQLETDRPGELRIRTDAVGARLLVVSEAWHAGWVARVDGNEVELLRAYGDYMACPVPAGQHLVEFSFEPQSWRLGLALSAAALLLLLLWLALALRSPWSDTTARRAP